jgi:hypothetical protein
VSDAAAIVPAFEFYIAGVTPADIQAEQTLSDASATMGTGEFRPPGQLEPLTLLTALSQATRHVGLIATVSSTYNDPYNLARRLASVDHVSAGRCGWNIVTSAGASEAANFGLDNRPAAPRSRLMCWSWAAAPLVPGPPSRPRRRERMWCSPTRGAADQALGARTAIGPQFHD